MYIYIYIYVFILCGTPVKYIVPQNARTHVVQSGKMICVCGGPISVVPMCP